MGSISIVQSAKKGSMFPKCLSGYTSSALLLKGFLWCMKLIIFIYKLDQLYHCCGDAHFHLERAKHADEVRRLVYCAVQS